MGSSAPPAPDVRVWLDGDFALGEADLAVDDALALAVVARAARRGLVEIAGVSAVSGQVDGVTARAVARDVLLAAGLDLPVHDEREAPDAMVRASGDLSVIALGPVTSVVGATLLDPGFARRVVVRAVTGVGTAWRRPARALLDPNRARNPVAADALAQAPFRARRLYPVDVAGELRLSPDDIQRLDARGGALGRLLAAGSQWWAKRARWRHPKAGFPARDLAPALDVLRRLPDARYDDAGVLTSFDAAGAREAALDLLDEAPGGY